MKFLLIFQFCSFMQFPFGKIFVQSMPPSCWWCQVSFAFQLIRSPSFTEKSFLFPQPQIYTGWWLTYPSDKYEFVRLDHHPQSGWGSHKTCSKPPTRYSRVNPYDIPIFQWFSHGFPMAFQFLGIPWYPKRSPPLSSNPNVQAVQDTDHQAPGSLRTRRSGRIRSPPRGSHGGFCGPP